MRFNSRTHLVATSVDHGQRLKQDMEDLLKKFTLEDPSLTPEQAMRKVQEELLKNNPFVPPKDGRCIINSLPVELLAHIFRVGVQMDGEGGDDEFEEVQDEGEKKALQDELRRGEGQKGEGAVDKGKRKESDEEIMEDDGNDEDWEDEPSESGDEDEDDYDEEDEEDDEEDQGPAFQVLVSHVCKHWRETALGTPDLWNHIEFIAPAQWDRYAAYLSRAKAQPLTLVVDGTCTMKDCGDSECEGHEDDEVPAFSPEELVKIFDLIVPYASQWQQIEFDMSRHPDMEMVLNRLHDIPEAPMLEAMHLHDEEWSSDEIPDSAIQDLTDLTLPFHGNAPNLSGVALWGVHLDWDATIPLFQNLKELDLAFHVKRPSFRTFTTWLKNSPNIRYMELDASGPALYNPMLAFPPETPATGLPSAYFTPATVVTPTPEAKEEGDPYEWPQYPIECPSLRDLNLGGHDPVYATAFASKFFFPKIRSLSFDYVAGDFTDTVEAYMNPVRGASTRRSAFSMVQSLQIKNLGNVRGPMLKNMLESLVSLHTLSLAVEGYDDSDAVADVLWRSLLDNGRMVKELIETEGFTPAKDDDTPMEPATKEPLTIAPPPHGAALPSVPPADENPVAKSVHPKLLLPSLLHLQAENIEGAKVREFVEYRKAVGAPMKSVLVHEFTEVEEEDEKWLRDNLDEFDYFSGSEDDYSDEEQDDMSFNLSDADVDVEIDDDEGEWEDEEDDEDLPGEGTDDEWVDEEDVDLEDVDEDIVVDEDGGAGKVLKAKDVPKASGQGAASSSVTQGLENLD